MVRRDCLCKERGSFETDYFGLIGIGSRYYGNRWAFTSAVTIVAMIGVYLLAFLSAQNQSGSLAAIYLVNAITGAQPVDFQWIMCNTAGHTKRAFVSAAMNAAFAVGAIIGPQTFQARDAPAYGPAKYGLAACWTVSLVLAWVLVLYYMAVNKKRGKKVEGTEEQDIDRTAWAGLTDKQNLRFRYQY